MLKHTGARMDYAQFAARYRSLKESAREEPTEQQTDEECGPASSLTLVGRIGGVTRSACQVEINEAVYELASKDLVDLRLLTEALRGDADPAEDDEDKEEIGITNEDFIALTIRDDAVLWRRVSVAAQVLAAAGTWISVVPNEAAPQDVEETAST